MATRKGKSDRPKDVFLVEQVRDLVDAIPPWDPAMRSPVNRGETYKKFKEDIRPLYGAMERLQAEFIPEGSSSGPLACTTGPRAPGTPLSNFLSCYDLCVHCQEEAKRVLRTIRDALQGKVSSGPFLSPEEKIARAKQYEAWARAEETRVAMRPTMTESFQRLVNSARSRAAAQLPVLTEDAAVFRDILVERGPKDALTGPRLCEL